MATGNTVRHRQSFATRKNITGVPKKSEPIRRSGGLPAGGGAGATRRGGGWLLPRQTEGIRDRDFGAEGWVQNRRQSAADLAEPDPCAGSATITRPHRRSRSAHSDVPAVCCCGRAAIRNILPGAVLPNLRARLSATSRFQRPESAGRSATESEPRPLFAKIGRWSSMSPGIRRGAGSAPRY